MDEDATRTDVTSPTRYEEHLGAPGFLWFLAVLLAVSVGVAYGAAIGGGWGFVAFAVLQALLAAWLLSSRARVAVDGTTFVAGRARLPLEFVATVEALDADATRVAAGPEADARAYLLLRGSGSSSVKVVLDDPADPTPYWLVSTRRPDALRAAIEAARPAPAP